WVEAILDIAGLKPEEFQVAHVWAERVKGIFLRSSKTQKAYEWIKRFLQDIHEKLKKGDARLVSKNGQINPTFARIVDDGDLVETEADFWYVEVSRGAGLVAWRVENDAREHTTTARNYTDIQNYMKRVTEALIPPWLKEQRKEMPRRHWLQIARELKVLKYLILEHRSAGATERYNVVDFTGNPVPCFTLQAIRMRLHSFNPPAHWITPLTTENALTKFHPVSRRALDRF
ncbi:uncharacterized protein JCM6883_003159, partial [Sporobolomyces salmoneus]|uniref:uncharacterized protein n=1 Tax=Sporobolomyces salmoneus TaxID=183962 RepID=UPI00317730E9